MAPEVFSLAREPITAHSFNADRSRNYPSTPVIDPKLTN